MYTYYERKDELYELSFFQVHDKDTYILLTRIVKRKYFMKKLW